MRVFAGVDPVTGRDRYLSESVKGTDRAARREAEKVMARLQTEVDGQRSAQSSVTLGFTLDEWLKTVEVEDSTRDGYIGYIERNIRPTLGAVPIANARRSANRETVHSDAGNVLRGAAPVPHPVQRPFDRRTPAGRRAHVRRSWMCAARVQTDGRFDRPPSACGDQRSAQRGRALGLDRRQPRAGGSAAPPDAASARPAVTGGRRAHRRWSIRHRRRLGHPRLAGDDYRHAARRSLRAALVTG